MTLDIEQVRSVVETQAAGQGPRSFEELASEIERLRLVKQGAPGSAATWLAPADLQEFERQEADLQRRAQKANTELKYFYRFSYAGGQLFWRDPSYENWPAEFRAYLTLPRELEGWTGTLHERQAAADAMERVRVRRLRWERIYRRLLEKDPWEPEVRLVNIARRMNTSTEEVEMIEAAAADPIAREFLRLEILSHFGDDWRDRARKLFGEKGVKTIERLLPEGV
jgi:hypothetical protein